MSYSNPHETLTHFLVADWCTKSIV